MTRVLVCDDSATCRAHLAELLRADPTINVVGEARDGREAVRLAAGLRPDLIVMDLWMPGLDGLAATREVMTTTPTPVVIVTASTAASDVAFGMQVLQAGALSLLPKPVGGVRGDDAAQRLVSAVRTLSAVKVVRQNPGSALHAPLPSPVGRAKSRVKAVAVASSTGGPAALQQLLGGLPAGFPASVLVVQHITAGFTEGLAKWLGTVCPLRVKVAAKGEPLRPGTVYVAPDGFHLAPTSSTAAELTSAPPVGGFRPSGTVLFEAAARAWGAELAAVVLTGMGDDGAAGLAAVKKAGGVVFAQDERSCAVYGMPAAAVAAGVVTHSLPPALIAARLCELAKP